MRGCYISLAIIADPRGGGGGPKAVLKGPVTFLFNFTPKMLNKESERHITLD